MSIFIYARIRRVLLSLGAAGLAACGADALIGIERDSRNQSIVASVGQDIHITLGNVGPGTYKSPPQISSGAVTFVDVEVVPPFTPAGPTQRFRFKALGSGQAIVHFTRTLGDSVMSVVEDTIQVR